MENTLNAYTLHNTHIHAQQGESSNKESIYKTSSTDSDSATKLCISPKKTVSDEFQDNLVNVFFSVRMFKNGNFLTIEQIAVCVITGQFREPNFEEFENGHPIEHHFSNAHFQFKDMLVTLFACMLYLMEILPIALGVIASDNALEYRDFNRKK